MNLVFNTSHVASNVTSLFVVAFWNLEPKVEHHLSKIDFDVLRPNKIKPPFAVQSTSTLKRALYKKEIFQARLSSPYFGQWD